MNCEDVRHRLPERWDGRLPDAERSEMDGHLASCATCAAEARSLEDLWIMLGDLPHEQPSESLRGRFDTMLRTYQQGLSDARAERSHEESPSSWLGQLWQRQPILGLAAVAALFFVGFLSGSLMLNRGNGHDELAVLRGEVSTMRQLLTLSLLRQDSASERLRAMSWSQRLDAPEDDVLSALLTALESDPNVNVRLAALGAVERFAGRSGVRQRLTQSLDRQSSPLVQIALIELLAQQQDVDSTSAIRRLVEVDELNPAVREKARLVLE